MKYFTGLMVMMYKTRFFKIIILVRAQLLLTSPRYLVGAIQNRHTKLYRLFDSDHNNNKNIITQSKLAAGPDVVHTLQRLTYC